MERRGGNAMARKELPVTGFAGVEIRSGNRVFISVLFHGKWVRERVRVPATPKGFQEAARIREEVNRVSRGGVITWGDWFPDSKRVPPPVSVPTFQSVSQGYLRRKKGLKPSTLKGYRKWVAYWDRLFGPMPINSIRRSHILDALDVIDWQNGKTMSNALTPLRGVFDEAMLDDLIEKNPVVAVDLPRTQRKPSKPLSSEQMHKVIKELDGSLWQTYFEIAFGTGMRPSEIMGLKWPDVNFKGRMLRIHNARTDSIDTGSTKAIRERSIDLNPMALRALKRQRFVSKGQGHVFINPYTRLPINTEQDPRRVWTKTLVAAKIPHRRAYETRHTHATIRLASGEPLVAVSRDLGHLKPSMTLDHYAGWIKEEETDLALKAFA